MACHIYLGLATVLIALSHAGKMTDFSTKIDIFTTQFTKEALSQTGGGDKSFVVAAPAAHIALALLATGARDDTQREITVVTKFNDVNEFIPYTKKRIEGFKQLKGFTFNTAKKLYVNSNKGTKAIASDFKSKAKDYFYYDVEAVDFSNEWIAADINKKVDEEMSGLFKDIIKPGSVDKDTSALIVNALHFSGRWAKKFDTPKTKSEDFTHADGSKKKVDMMFQEGNFNYRISAELDATIIELPYEGHDASMFVYLPKRIDGLDDLESKIVGESKKFTDNLERGRIMLKLPKFKIENYVDWKTIFENLGVKRVFDAKKSQLSGILTDGSNSHVSNIVHKAIIEVAEEGETVVISALPEDLPPVINVDHPFYYEVILKEAASVILSGRYMG